MHLPETSTRLNSMGARPDLWPRRLDTLERIRRAGSVDGLDLVDLNYPQHVDGLATDQVVAALRAAGLGVGAINLRYDDTFLDGAFTHPDAATRRRAVDLTIAAGEWALATGAKQVIVWPGQDGYDYPFQVDYQALWDHTVEGFQRVADALPELQIALEYKPLEPRRFYAVGDMSTSLLCVRDVARANVGVALDVAHALMARENPAQAAARALRETRLTQPALYLTQVALAQLWIARGVRPAAMIGHSVGEFAAATISGVMDFEAGLNIIAARGRLMQDQPGGAMLSVRADLAEMRQDIAEARQRLGHLEAQYATISGRLDRMAGDIGRIRDRLGLIDA